MNLRLLLIFLSLLVLVTPSVAGSGSPDAGGHYVPQSGDRFHYYENVELANGSGNYTGYTESTFINGTVGVTGVQADGNDSASYQNTVSWSNNTGSSYHWPSSGNFTFSSENFLYLQGTDNQTGYTNPYVWFYINNSAQPGARFYLLNSAMNLVSRNVSYPLGSHPGQYFQALFAEGNGSFQRNDEYGVFTATYNWKAYFDPTTGYIIGYLYTEQDSDGVGDGFSLNDLLYVTSTTYALTAATATSTTTEANGGPSVLALALVAVIVVIIVVVVVVLVSRGRRSSLPRHSGQGKVGFGSSPGVPPPIHLTPAQPGVEQIVLRETVKVNCRYCGALIDTTAKACPNCGAPRS